MKTLFNSIVRGFGSTLGRKAANSITRNSNVVSEKNYLTFWEGIKTILWFFPMLVVSLFLNMIWDIFTNKNFMSENYVLNFPIVIFWAVIFTLIIGYNYYNKSKLNS